MDSYPWDPGHPLLRSPRPRDVLSPYQALEPFQGLRSAQLGALQKEGAPSTSPHASRNIPAKRVEAAGTEQGLHGRDTPPCMGGLGTLTSNGLEGPGRESQPRCILLKATQALGPRHFHYLKHSP